MGTAATGGSNEFIRHVPSRCPGFWVFLLRLLYYMLRPTYSTSRTLLIRLFAEDNLKLVASSRGTSNERVFAG